MKSVMPANQGGMMSGGMMGSATSADMSTYMDLFNRHTDIRRTVEMVPGGIRTTTESDAPDLVGAAPGAHLQHVQPSQPGGRGHVHERQPADPVPECDRLPPPARDTSKGVTVTETSTDPALTSAIRRHAREVSGFVRDGMPATSDCDVCRILDSQVRLKV